jgi:hypothetical protein
MHKSRLRLMQLLRNIPISLFALQPLEPSDGCLVLRKWMANG